MKLHLILNFTSVIDILADSVHCNSNGKKLFSWLKARVKISMLQEAISNEDLDNQLLS